MISRRDLLRAAAGIAASACVPRSTSQGLADVCIVGTGPGGTILASELARRGITCILVEGGDRRLSARDYGSQDYPVEETRFLGLGGTSNLWGGSCSRFHPRDFERGGWPLRYEDIEPYYERAERELLVAGRASRYAPPRRGPYPRAVPADFETSLTNEVFSSAGVDVEYPPLANRSRMVESHLPALQASPLVTVTDKVRVRRVRSDSEGRITALQAITEGGEDVEIVAKSFVLACGGIETPRLLLASRSSRFPHGIGNDSDHVGRHFMEHLWAPLGHATVVTRALRSAESPMEALTWEAADRMFGQGSTGAHLECLAGLPEGVRIAALWEMSPEPDNRVTLDYDKLDQLGDPTARVQVNLSETDRRMHRQLLTIAESVLVRLKPQSVRTAMVPTRWCHHHMGTCRMGVDPRHAVVDPSLRVHGTQNLFLCGSSTFCSGGAGPPTLLLVAFAIRLADHLQKVSLS